MFNIFKQLRALCTRTREPAAMRASRSNGPRSLFQGQASTKRRRMGADVRHLPKAIAALLFAVPAMADPPASDYVASEQHDQRVELVRAAFHTTHHPAEWGDFDPSSVFAASESDRVSVESMIGGTSLQRKRAAEFILTTPAYARLVMAAYYPSVVIIPG